MALAVARDASAANHPPVIANAITERPASPTGGSPRRPRRLSVPATSVPVQSRIVLRGTSVLYR
jgi:hypothetical protein